MYRPAAYTRDDPAVLHQFIRRRSFATIAAVLNGEIEFAYAPVVLDTDSGPLGGVRLHFARANPLAAIDGTTVRLSFLGPDAYVSPDWYATKGLVPTWNYVAVEASGVAQCLDTKDLRELLVNLSAAHEEKLRPKKPWTIDKVPEGKLDALMNAIVGFVVPFATLEGKFKLSQDKVQEDFDGVVANLEISDGPASRAIAALMRANRQKQK